METLVPSGTKYMDRQMVDILSFCGLKPSKWSELPEIWTTLQSRKDWYDTGLELTKWFKKG